MIQIQQKPIEKIIKRQELQLSKEYQEVEAEFKTVELLVRDILEKSQIARNSDNWLIAFCWQKTGYAKIEDGRLRQDIGVEEIKRLPTAETITRCRRKIQNTEGKFLPTAPETMIKRRIKEECVKAYFGDNSYEYTEYKKLRYKIK